MNASHLVQMDVKYVPYRIKGQQHYQYTALDDGDPSGTARAGDSPKSIMSSQ